MSFTPACILIYREDKMVKDFPLGVLIMVISFFPLGFAFWLANNPPLLTWLAMLVSFLIYQFIFNIGWRIAITGVKVADDEEQ